jgi:hypothetical protein
LATGERRAGRKERLAGVKANRDYRQSEVGKGNLRRDQRAPERRTGRGQAN